MLDSETDFKNEQKIHKHQKKNKVKNSANY